VTNRSRFDNLSASYDELLRDPIRDRFAGKNAEFFHLRKSILIRDYFQRRSIDTRTMSYLDVGCGKGQLLKLLEPYFSRVAGCDVSVEMMRSLDGVETRVQDHPLRIPFPENSFDFMTAVCVYHHIAIESRLEFSIEVSRVLKPGGILAIIEHNPFNPVTRLIVSRTPVDSDAILLRPAETRKLAREAGLRFDEQPHFLYFPEKIYWLLGGVESALRRVPFGGQYALFAKKPAAEE
jgi:SAM-dependent methyltransferase